MMPATSAQPDARSGTTNADVPQAWVHDGCNWHAAMASSSLLLPTASQRLLVDLLRRHERSVALQPCSAHACAEAWPKHAEATASKPNLCSRNSGAAMLDQEDHCVTAVASAGRRPALAGMLALRAGPRAFWVFLVPTLLASGTASGTRQAKDATHARTACQCTWLQLAITRSAEGGACLCAAHAANSPAAGWHMCKPSR